MARVKFNASAAAKKFKKDLDKVSANPAVEKAIGTFLTTRVKLEARRGRPLNSTRSFPDLKESTKRIRKSITGVHRAFRAGKSNLTISGFLQDSLTFKRKSKGLFELFIKSRRHPPYKLKSGKTLFQEETDTVAIDKDLRALGFALVTAKGLKSEGKILRRIKQIYLRFLRRRLRRT